MTIKYTVSQSHITHENMISLELSGAESLVLKDKPAPASADGCEPISVNIASIGGSEYLAYANPGMRALPNVMAHGFCGLTTEGLRVAVFPLSGCGDCTYCQADHAQLCDNWSLIGVHSDGGFQQSVSVPSSSLVPIPAGLTWEQCAFIEPFANSINAWETSGANGESKVAIVGLGGLGLGLTLLAAAAGCQTIHAVDLSGSRQTAGAAAGADIVGIDLPEEYDVVFDTVGSESTRATALSKTVKGGSCVLLGFSFVDMKINAVELIRQQKKLMGSFVFSKQQFHTAIDLASSADSNWVTNITFDEVEDTLKKFLQADFGIIKAALRPNGIDRPRG